LWHEKAPSVRSPRCACCCVAAPDEAVSQSRLEADVARLVAFGTRQSLSSQDDPKRGIGAARKWAEAEFRKTSAACGGCLEIVLPETMVQGERVPTPVRLVDVVAIQRRDWPNEVVIVQGHIDSRNSDAMDAKGEAPGANDDGSGTALLEAARALACRKFAGTIVYAVLSGEEQGLYGGKLLADYAKAQGWTVKAVLDDDIVGNSRGSDGLTDDTHVRVFSEGPRDDASDRTRAAQRAIGGENDSPSRNLSRWLAGLGDDGLSCRQVWRADRMGRGGAHLPFQEMGYPAAALYRRGGRRLRTAAPECADRGRSSVWRYDGGDGLCLSRQGDPDQRAGTREAGGGADAACGQGHGGGADLYRCRLERRSGGGALSLWQRRTDAAGWDAKPVAETAGTHVRLDSVRGDDWFFGVSTVAADGSESPIASAVPGGAYLPGRRPSPDLVFAACSAQRSVMAIRKQTPNGPDGLPTRQQVLDFITQSEEPAGKREISKAFGLKGTEKIALKALLKDIGRGRPDRRQSQRVPPGSAAYRA
jgi:hypothetical protein